MGRKNASDPTSDAAFESHLSTVTKLGLGMLILITMASTFSSQMNLGQSKFKRQLGAPITTTAAEDDVVLVIFECHDNRAIPIVPDSFDRVGSDIGAFLRGPRTGADMDQLARQDNAKDYGHEYYQFEFKVKSGHKNSFLENKPVVILHPRPGAGETLEQLQKPDSKFRQRLQVLDEEAKKKKENDPDHKEPHRVVRLRVWSDSFEFFRSLRELLQKESYLIGWQPADDPIAEFGFGGGGGIGIDR